MDEGGRKAEQLPCWRTERKRNERVVNPSRGIGMGGCQSGEAGFARHSIASFQYIFLHLFVVRGRAASSAACKLNKLLNSKFVHIPGVCMYGYLDECMVVMTR